MAKVLARMKLEYDSDTRFEKLEALSKVLKANPGCIMKIREPSVGYPESVFYIRPGKCSVTHNSNTHVAEMTINSKGMLFFNAPDELPELNTWKIYTIEWGARYDVIVYDALPKREIAKAERNSKQNILSLKRKLDAANKEYLKVIEITQNTKWLGFEGSILDYEPIL